MLPSGSTRPDQPTANVSKLPASARLRDVTNSVGASETSIPTAFSIAWTTCPSRAATGSVAIVSVTLGLATPDALTSFCAVATLAWRLHCRPFVVVYQGLTGEIG